MPASLLRLSPLSRTFAAPRDLLHQPPAGNLARPPRPRIGEILVARGELSADNLNRALRLQAREAHRPLGEILLEDGALSRAELALALAEQRGARPVDLLAEPPDIRLLDRLGAERCLTLGLVPWRDVGGAVAIATGRPEDFEDARAELEAAFGPTILALADTQAVTDAVKRYHGRALGRAADRRTAEDDSCRSLESGEFSGILLVTLTSLAVLTVGAPGVIFTMLTGWAVLCLALMTGLRSAAALSELIARARMSRRFTTGRAEPEAGELPVVSVLVPLLREAEVLEDLTLRLLALEYPQDKLDICLIVEGDDTVMRGALAKMALPRNMRVVEVPVGAVRTKPRALNYALDFCRGSIVGVYDAEDAPDRDQIAKIVRRFAEAPAEVVCLQGRLDFYNARQNWLARCFTVDYATWFRVILPGLSRLGFAIPLGGTTLFFRRAALEEMGRWDAHNVTEDADLGIRLARRGYRAELVDTTTREEATCNLRGWIRQRARWMKGYTLTYAVHMRRPRQLWRELGAKRFFGFQVMFLGTVSLFLLAPVLWSFWLLPLGFEHPLAGIVPSGALLALVGMFIVSELLTIATELIAVSGPRHRWLMLWVPTLHFYYPLAAVAAWKGLAEIVTRPFFWDKTSHGKGRADP